MYTEIETTFIPNTIMELHENGQFYSIRPIEGYALHTKELDIEEYDEEGRFIRTVRGYTEISTTCGANYDFSTHIITDEDNIEYTAYGKREFYTKPIID